MSMNNSELHVENAYMLYHWNVFLSFAIKGSFHAKMFYKFEGLKHTLKVNNGVDS